MKKRFNQLGRMIVIMSVFLMYAQRVQAQSTVVCILEMSADSIICVNNCAAVTNTSYGPLGNGDTACFPNYYWTAPGGTPATYLGFSPGCITYTTPGFYTITLYSVDNQGNIQWQNSVYDHVTVVGPPDPSFTYSPVAPCMNDLVSFSVVDTTLNPNNYITWDFGDGNFGNGPIAVNQYQTSGTFTVTCCVGNACDTICSSQEITIHDASPNFTWTSICNRVDFFPDTFCIQLASTHFWDFGDATTSTLVNPTHIYSQNGVGYFVTHTITTPNGTFSYSTTVFQQGPPVANIVGWQVNNCGNGTITYTAAPCLPGISYTWGVTVGSNLSNTTGCTTNINWGTNGGYVTLAAWDSVADCTGYDTLRIPVCCHLPSQYQIDNTTASAVLATMGCVTGNVVDGTCIAGAPIRISGVFVVDVPIVFQNCASINISTNTPILIDSGQSLTFDNCFVDKICDTMWDGIYIPDPTASLNIINGSVIQFAKHAVVSNNCGDFFIENSTLQNNDTDMVVNQCNTLHNGIVRGTAFTMNGPMLPALPALLPGHTETVCAIEIRDNAGITIGDASLVANRNHFTDILVGVRAHNSITTIKNARFFNFTPTAIQTGNVANAGTGVVAFGNKGTAYAPALTVGGAGLNQCFFSDMVIGVDAFERIHVTVIRNNIFKVRRFGIRVQRSQQTFININDNLITNASSPFAFNTGILVLECYQATVNINSNNIYAPNPVPFQTGVGIRVGLVTPGNVTLNVFGNSIDRLRTGIWMQNLTGKNLVYITNNKVNFRKANPQYTTVHYGIRLENCATVRVRYNAVTKTTAPAPVLAMRDNLRGVSMENSTVSYIAHNKFTRMGSGVYGWELCGGSSMVCDTFVTCYDGFFFTGGVATGGACDIGDQVIDISTSNPAPTGCKWTSSGNADITGFIQPAINWYRDATPINQAGMNPASFVTGLTVFSPNPSGCNLPQYFMQQSPAVERDQNAGQAVFNPGTYSPGTQQGYQGRRNAHRKLKETPTWMVLGTPQDSSYAGFYMINEQVNIGLFRNFEDMAAVDSVNAAGSILNSIADTNLSESNLKVVYSIYQQTWMQGIYEFTPADSAVLYGIAVQYASDAGEGVYSARVLLGLDVDEYGASGNRYGNPDESSDESVQAMSLYPNPATDQLTVNTTLVEGQTSTVIITDLQGKIVMSKNVTVSGQLIIDVSTLDNGMYFVQMVVDGVLIETNKLEVIHE